MRKLLMQYENSSMRKYKAEVRYCFTITIPKKPKQTSGEASMYETNKIHTKIQEWFVLLYFEINHYRCTIFLCYLPLPWFSALNNSRVTSNQAKYSLMWEETIVFHLHTTSELAIITYFFLNTISFSSGCVEYNDKIY